MKHKDYDYNLTAIKYYLNNKDKNGLQYSKNHLH